MQATLSRCNAIQQDGILMHTPRKRMGGQTEGNEERETGRKRVGERIKR